MADFSSAWLLRKKQFRSLAGVRPDECHKMVRLLRPHWQDRIEKPKDRDGRPWGVGGLEDHLLVLLIACRCHTAQDFLACLYGVNKSTISRSLKRIERLAQGVLGVKKRIALAPEEAESLVIDCTEQPVQRPQRKQRRWYSGKKKRHTVKNEIIIAERGRIVAVSDDAPGRVHDIEARRRGPPLPKDAHAYADSGYQGYQKDHPSLEIPCKSSKNKPLAKDEREYNHALSRFRVRVEHAIARLKTFRILSDRYRYPKAGHIVKISIVAGIVNLTSNS